MNPMILLAAFGSRPLVLQTVTFNANATWVAPADVSLLPSVVGHGVAGDAGSTTPGYTAYYDHHYIRKDGGPNDHVHSEGTFSGSKPSNTYTRTYIGDTSTVYNYDDLYTTYTDGPDIVVPGTTGASATGFGKTFVGGTGGAATTDTYANVAVTPGASYTVVVPSGATIQITYYQ